MDEFDKEALDTLKYEFNTMHFGKEYIREHENDNDFMSNAALEAFLTHVRLIYAFFSKPRMKDDIVVEDLVDDTAKWNNIEPSLFPNLSKPQEIGGIEYKNGWYDLIHKHLAHLSKARLSCKPVWPISDLYYECQEALKMFVDCLNEEKKKWFTERI